MKRKLSARQKRFCDEYLISLNATQAAIKAGYSEKTAKNQAHNQLTKVYVSEYIAKKKAERAEKLGIDAGWVLREAEYLYNKCKTELERNPELPKGVVKEAVSALKLVGSHINVNAFEIRTKAEISGINGAPVEILSVSATATAEEAEDIYKKLMK